MNHHAPFIQNGSQSFFFAYVHFHANKFENSFKTRFIVTSGFIVAANIRTRKNAKMCTPSPDNFFEIFARHVLKSIINEIVREPHEFYEIFQS